MWFTSQGVCVCVYIYVYWYSFPTQAFPNIHMEAQNGFKHLDIYRFSIFIYIYIFIDIYNSKDMFLITTTSTPGSGWESITALLQSRPIGVCHKYKENKPRVRAESEHSGTEQLRAGKESRREQHYMSNGGLGLSGREGLALPGRLETKQEKGKGRERVEKQ